MIIKDLTRLRFGRLRVAALHPIRDKSGQALWVCVCNCGNETVVAGSDLRRRTTVSCGCYRMDNARKTQNRKFLKHSHARNGFTSRTYNAWRGMMRRCYTTTDKAYKYYGARGIKVCKRWRVFKNFLADMGEVPPGRSLDRIDNDGNYTPKNCRWATHFTQIHNRRPQSQWIAPPGPQ